MYSYWKLEDVCEILDSQRVPITAKDRKKGSYPYYGANGIQDFVSDYIFDDELVLLAEDGGNFGSTERPIAYRVSGKCWVNNHAHVLKAKEAINVDYLCYSLMFYNTNGLVNGATRQKLTQAAMRQMKIPSRSLQEQDKIVEKIKSVLEAISIKKEELENLEQLIKTRFVEMFGDCKNMVVLNDLCSIITDGTHQPPKFQSEGIPFIFVSNLANNEVTYAPASANSMLSSINSFFTYMENIKEYIAEELGVILYKVLNTKLDEDFIRHELHRYIPETRREELRTKQLFVKYFYQVLLYQDRKPGIYTEFDDHMRRVIILEFYKRIIATYLDKTNR